MSSGPADWLDVPVWVDLDQLYGPAPEDVKPWPGGDLVHGLVLTGKVPGRLRQWAAPSTADGSASSTSWCATATARPWPC